MIDRNHTLPIFRQARAPGISRGSISCLPRATSAADLALMRKPEIESIDRRPNTSKPAPGHKIYPYLMKHVAVTRPNHAWAIDITYIPMARGFVYLCAVVAWFSRRVLSWKLTITLETAFRSLHGGIGVSLEGRVKRKNPPLLRRVFDILVAGAGFGHCFTVSTHQFRQ